MTKLPGTGDFLLNRVGEAAASKHFKKSEVFLKNPEGFKVSQTFFDEHLHGKNWQKFLRISGLSLPQGGVLRRSQDYGFTWVHDMEWVGQLESLEVAINFQAGTMNNIQLKVSPPKNRATYWVGVEALGIVDCSNDRNQPGTCTKVMQVPHSKAPMGGKWTYEFTFDAAVDHARVNHIDVIYVGAPESKKDY